MNYGRSCEQPQQQQRQLTTAGEFKFDSTQTAIGWIVSPRSPLVDGTYMQLARWWSLNNAENSSDFAFLAV